MYQLNYGFTTFCLIFYIYCVLGWCFESIYVSLKSKKRINRGFMKGPFLPIYGCGAVIILFSTIPVITSPLLVYAMSVISATVLELATGVVMERLFKVKYWDYSNNFLNYKGYICIKSSITWGFMGMLVTYVINEPVAGFINSLSNEIIGLIVDVITVIFVYDFAVSFREAYNLREIILNNAKLMAEINELKVNIVVAIGEAGDKRDEIKEKIENAIFNAEIDEIIIERLKKLHMEEYIEKWKEKTADFSQGIEELNKIKNSILKRNPSAKARIGVLKEIRELAKRRKQ